MAQMLLRNAKPAGGISLAPHHDVGFYADVFRRQGRIHIPDILREEDARSIHDALAKRTAWSIVVVQDKGVRDFSGEELAIMTTEQRQTMESAVMISARDQYVGRYRNCRLSNDGETYRGGPPVLSDLTTFLNSPDFLDFARAVTGHDIDFADAQATCYDPGDFLHGHTDKDIRSKRCIAYVLNLTPRWRTEWGGLLGFIDGSGHLSEAFAPVWNGINLLRVDQLHFVSTVAPFAGARRYSVTGWLRVR